MEKSEARPKRPRRSSRPPLVTIGMPVRNGGPRLEEAITSLQYQTETRFVLRISDNASTDGTAALLEKLAKKDPRIRVTRHEADRGAVANFNGLLDEARERAETPFFVWAAHDDRWDPTFLERSLASLTADPSAVGTAHGLTIEDEDGAQVRTILPPQGLASADVLTRVRAMRRGPWWFACYGVFRLERLPADLRLEDVWQADGVFVFAALLRGPFAVVSEVVQRYRIIEVRSKSDRGALYRVDIAGMRRRMDAAVDDASEVIDAQRRIAVKEEASLACRRVARVTEADRHRRAMRRARWEGRPVTAVGHAAVVVALRPVMTARSVRRRFGR